MLGTSLSTIKRRMKEFDLKKSSYYSTLTDRELDKMVNLESGKKFSQLIKNSTIHVIEGCGHMIMIEKAFEMRDKVLEFLNK